MLKVISLMKRKEGMSLEEFRHWAFEEHPALGMKLPGIRHYRMSVVLQDNPARGRKGGRGRRRRSLFLPHAPADGREGTDRLNG
jgi:EthD domain